MDSFKNRLAKGMQLRQMRAVDLADRTGLSRPLISQYLSGKCEAKQTPLHKIALALNVSEVWLMGYDVDMERPYDTKRTLMENLRAVFGSDAVELLASFLTLNEQGKLRAVQQINDLTDIARYRL